MIKNISNTPEIIYPFVQPFLSSFFVDPNKLPFNEEALKIADQALAGYEKSEIDWRLEKTLRQRNDMLVSFAVSKAENSSLTLAEAADVYNSIDRAPSFLLNKLKTKEKLTQKDHDKLEYYNIAKIFRLINEQGLRVSELTPELILNLHAQLTENLDVFHGHIVNFEIYHSGYFRDNDKTKVGDYQPAPCQEIEASISELIDWLKKEPSAINVFIFHAALYALHPFKNGNKRVCRVLEHFLLQDVGYNNKNLYSTSYYYHKHKDRYYKNLVEALYKHNLNYFVSFASEALLLSIVGVTASVLQRKKAIYLSNSGLDDKIIKVLKPLIKRREVKFGRFYALAKRKIVRQTFINYLSEAVEKGIVIRREQGKNVYYSLAGTYLETSLINNWLVTARDKINFLPNDLVVYL